MTEYLLHVEDMVTLLICGSIGGKLNLNAHNDAKWITLEELDEQKWVPADVLVVKALKQ